MHHGYMFSGDSTSSSSYREVKNNHVSSSSHAREEEKLNTTSIIKFVEAGGLRIGPIDEKIPSITSNNISKALLNNLKLHLYKNTKIILDSASQGLNKAKQKKLREKGIRHIELYDCINSDTLDALSAIQDVDNAKVFVISATAGPSSNVTEFFNWLFSIASKLKLQKLCLDTPLSVSQFSQLIEFIADNYTLKILDICNNQIPEELATAFINAIQDKKIVIFHNANFILDVRIKKIVDRNTSLKEAVGKSSDFRQSQFSWSNLPSLKEAWNNIKRLEDEKVNVQEEKVHYFKNLFEGMKKYKFDHEWRYFHYYDEDKEKYFDLDILASINQFLIELFTQEKVTTQFNSELLNEIAFQGTVLYYFRRFSNFNEANSLLLRNDFNETNRPFLRNYNELKEQASYIDKKIVEFFPYVDKAMRIKMALINEPVTYFDGLIREIKELVSSTEVTKRIEDLKLIDDRISSYNDISAYTELFGINLGQEYFSQHCFPPGFTRDLKKIIEDYILLDTYTILERFLTELKQIVHGFVVEDIESTNNLMNSETYRHICKIIYKIKTTTSSKEIIKLCNDVKLEWTGVQVFEAMNEQEVVQCSVLGTMIVDRFNSILLEWTHFYNPHRKEVYKIVKGVPHPWMTGRDDKEKYYLFSDVMIPDEIIPKYKKLHEKNLAKWEEAIQKEYSFSKVYLHHKKMFDFVIQLKRYSFFQELCLNRLKNYLKKDGFLEQLLLKANREGRFFEIKEHLAAVQSVCLNIPELSSNFCHCIFRVVAKFDEQMQKATPPSAIGFEGETKVESKDEINLNHLNELAFQFAKLETLFSTFSTAIKKYELKLEHAEITNKMDELLIIAQRCVSLAEKKADINEKIACYEKAINLFILSDLPIELSKQRALKLLNFAFDSLRSQEAPVVKSFIDLVLKQKNIKPKFFDKEVLEVIYAERIKIENFSGQIAAANEVLREAAPVNIQRLQNLIAQAQQCQEKLDIINQYLLETADESTLDCCKRLAPTQPIYQELQLKIIFLFDNAVNAASKLQDIPSVFSLEQHIENLLKIYEISQNQFVGINLSKEEELLNLTNANLPYSANRQRLLLPIFKKILFKKIALARMNSSQDSTENAFIQEVNAAQTMDGFNTILNRHASFWSSSPSRQECYKLINYHVYKKILNPGFTRDAVLLEKTRQQKQQAIAKTMEIPTTFVFSLINVFIANPLTKNILYASFKYPLFLLTTLVELFWFKTIFNSYPDSKSKANSIELVIGWIKLPLVLASILAFASDFLNKGILNLINLGEQWWGHTNNLGNYGEGLDWFSNIMGGVTAGSFIVSVFALSVIKDIVIAIYHLVMSYRAYTPRERDEHWQQCMVKAKLSVMLSLITVSMLLGNGLSFFGYTLFEPIMTTLVVGAMSLSLTMFLCALGSFAMGFNAVWNNTQEKPLWQRIGGGVLLGTLNTTLTLVLGPIVGGALLSLLSGPLLPVMLVSLAVLTVINVAFPRFFPACVEKLHLSKQTIWAGVMLTAALCSVLSWPTLVIVLPLMGTMLAIHVKYPTFFADLAKTIVAGVLSLVGLDKGEKQVVPAPSAMLAPTSLSSNSKEDIKAHRSTQRIAHPTPAMKCPALMLSSLSNVNPIMPPETSSPDNGTVSSAASMSLVYRN